MLGSRELARKPAAQAFSLRLQREVELLMVRSLGGPWRAMEGHGGPGGTETIPSRSSASAEVLEFTGDDGGLEGADEFSRDSFAALRKALEMEPPPTTAPPEERQR